MVDAPKGLDPFKFIVDHAGEEFYLARANGEFEYVNEAAAKSLGYTCAELLELGVAGIDPDYGQRFSSHFATLKEHDLEPFETTHIAKDGARVPKEIKSIYLRLGELEYVCGFGRDISARKRAEQELKEGESRFRLLVEGSPEVFFYLHDAEHRFLYLSPSIANVLGYRPEELLGKVYDETLAGDDSDATVLEQTERALATGERGPAYCAVLRHRSGRKVIAEIIETPVARDGTVLIHGFARDVTKRVQAELAERAAKDGLERLLAAIPDGVVVVERDGRLGFVNAAAERILGRRRAELSGTALEWRAPAAGSGAEPVLAARALDDVLRTGEAVVGLEVEVDRGAGGSVVLSLNATPHPAGGGIVLAFQDVTERSELSRMKTEFLNIASHELRTPLTPLRLLLDMSLAALSRGQLEASALVRMNRYCEQLALLIDDLLDVSRLQRGRLLLRRERMDLRQSVADVFEHFRRRDPTRRLTLALPEDALIADADPTRIEQVVYNLLDNAVRYGGADAPIEVALRRVRDNAELTVRDHGPGIAAEVQAALFSAWPVRPPGAAGGLGLGLYICRSIAELHGGSICCDALPGDGSTFTVVLPVLAT